jgi:RNA polymerase sigma factor (sigma-70 family)
MGGVLVVSPQEPRLNEAENQVLSLLSEHGPRLYSLLVKITLREDVAEDLMQELFIRLSRRGVMSRAVDPVGYAVRAATRLAFDWRRSHRRRPDTTAIDVEFESAVDSPVRRLEQREDLQAVLDAIEKLSTVCRSIIVMRYLEGRPYQEISATVGKSLHQTRSLCYKSIVHLRTLAKVTRPNSSEILR